MSGTWLLLTGLIISTAPAEGRSVRFFTRASVGWWQELVDLCGQGTKDELTLAVKEELVFWLERLEKVSSQSIRSEPVTTGSTRVARKGNEINEKRFQCPLLDWEVVKVVPTGSSGPWRWGSIY